MLSKRFVPILAVLALAGGVLACGDDDEPANDSPAQEQSTTESSGSSSSGGGEPTDANIEAAIDACKESVNNQPQLSEDVKSDLADICEEAASGDPEDVKKATRKVCERIVEEQVPEGAQRDQALETCRTATE